MGLISNLLSGGTGKLVDSIGDVLDKVVTTKGEKMQLDNEMAKAEYDFKVETQKLSAEEQQMVLGDIDSARKREAEVQTSANATKLSKNISPYLALGTTVLTFVLFYTLIFDQQMCKDEHSKDVLIYILGVLSAIITQIFSFYFGSSQGSQAKNATIEKLHNQVK